MAANPGSGMRSAMRSGTRSTSGETDRTGYSVAGEEARSRREVVGCGDRMVGEVSEEEGEEAEAVGEVGESMTTVAGTGWTGWTGWMGLTTWGPVRMLEGRICSKPCWRATCSMDLKYWGEGREMFQSAILVRSAPRDKKEKKKTRDGSP